MDDGNYDSHCVLLCTINHNEPLFHEEALIIHHSIVICIIEDTDVYNTDVAMSYGVDMNELIA